jgi:creatinine amidohydrolase
MMRPRSRRPLIAIALSFCLPAAYASSVFASSPATVILQDLTWIELRDSVAKGNTTVIIPIRGDRTKRSGNGSW